jgi:hypothetical protein
MAKEKAKKTEQLNPRPEPPIIHKDKKATIKDKSVPRPEKK